MTNDEIQRRVLVFKARETEKVEAKAKPLPPEEVAGFYQDLVDGLTDEEMARIDAECEADMEAEAEWQRQENAAKLKAIEADFIEQMKEIDPSWTDFEAPNDDDSWDLDARVIFHTPGKKLRGDSTKYDRVTGTAIIDGVFYSAEQLYLKMLSNESFHGVTISREAVERFFVLANAAKQLEQEHAEIVGVQFLPPHTRRRHAGVILDVKWLSGFDKSEMMLFEKLFANADRFHISGIRAGLFRMSFDVKNVYS